MTTSQAWSGILSIAFVGSCAFAGDPPPKADDDAQPAPAASAEEIRLLLSVLDSPHPETSHTALKQLLAIGRPVLPFLEDRLRLRAGDAYVDLLRGIGLLPEPTKDQDPAARLEEMKANAGTANPVEVDKFLSDKFLAAQHMFDGGRFEQCKALVEGILAVEPSCTLRADLKNLKLLCEQRITESTIARPTLTTRDSAYRAQDRIDLAFQLEDVTTGPVDLDFTGSLMSTAKLPKNAQNFILADVTITDYTAYGDMRSWNRRLTFDLKANASLSPGKPWIYHAGLDLSPDPPTKMYRTYKIEAEVRPYMVRTAEGDTHGRKITFPPLTFGVFPVEDDLEVVRAHALERLSLAFDAIEGNKKVGANDVFLVCMLMPEADKSKAVDLLMHALGHPRASDVDKQLFISCLRQLTHLPLDSSEETWLQYWHEHSGDMNAQPK